MKMNEVKSILGVSSNVALTKIVSHLQAYAVKPNKKHCAAIYSHRLLNCIMIFFSRWVNSCTGSLHLATKMP